MMMSHLSLKTTVLVVSILISGILIPYSVFASPIFENDSFQPGGAADFHWEPEQTWSNEDGSGKARVTSTDVAVFAGETLQEVYVIFVANPDGAGPRVHLAYTNNVTLNPFSGSPYYADFFNTTSTVKLNENDSPQFCNFPIISPNVLPQVAVTVSHVFVSWLD